MCGGNLRSGGCGVEGEDTSAVGQSCPLLLYQVRGALVHFLLSTRGALGRFSARLEGDLAPESDEA